MEHSSALANIDIDERQQLYTKLKVYLLKIVIFLELFMLLLVLFRRRVKIRLSYTVGGRFIMVGCTYCYHWGGVTKTM